MNTGIAWQSIAVQFLCFAMLIIIPLGCAYLAHVKGRNWAFWGFTGLLFNIIPILILMNVPTNLGIAWQGMAAQLLCFAMLFTIPLGCAYLANAKGRNWAFWGFMGLLFNIIPLLILIAVPKNK